ncbi:MAG: hypothetical protein QOJ96_706 [Alphaproteobacteria bacterium]|nr:hypothetical protein [Alphaproteobacteria bacterium]
MLCHPLGTHDARKLWHLCHAGELTADRIKASHYHRKQIVKVMSNATGQLTNGFELLRLAQRGFHLVATCNFFRNPLFKRGVELLKSQGCGGYIFARAIERFGEMRCVSRRLHSRTFARQCDVNPRLSFQQFD